MGRWVAGNRTGMGGPGGLVRVQGDPGDMGVSGGGPKGDSYGNRGTLGT